MDALLSVVIPTHNRKDMLREMLLSLSDQTLAAGSFEVVVVDDGSTDGTPEMLRGLRTPYRLVPVSQPQSGPSRARNAGAASASGSMLVFLDDDLLPEKQLLEEHLRLLEANRAMVVLGRLIPWGKGPRGGWNRWEERVYERHYRAVQANQRPASGRRLYSGNFGLWRDQFLGVGGFDESLKRGEDVELGFRLERTGAEFRFNPEAAAVHRGFRGFQSWCNSAYLYGRSDVQLAVERGHHQVLDEIFGWYHHKAPIVRLLVQASLLGGKPFRATAIRLLRVVAGAFDRLNLTMPAHYGYGAIFNLQYWQGVADQLGGRKAFTLRAARPSNPALAGNTRQ